jgi:UDP-glucose 4-epimerase
MKVLITGSQGRIGRVVTELVRADGHTVRTLDRAAASVEWEHIPGDILNLFQMRQAVQGCEAIIHLAAIPNDWNGRAEMVFDVNVMGTWNMLQAAAEAGIKKFVFFSSVNALGIWGGMRSPEYLPIDDAHPHYPRPAYGLSKHVGEEMCQSFSRLYGISTLCLRPCLVTGGSTEGSRRRSDSTRWMVGDYFSYVDVRDVARAAILCLRADSITHGRYLLTAAENAAQTPTAELVREHYAAIPWRGSSDYLDNPLRSLVDTSAAERDLGWKPEHIREDWKL